MVIKVQTLSNEINVDSLARPSQNHEINKEKSEVVTGEETKSREQSASINFKNPESIKNSDLSKDKLEAAVEKLNNYVAENKKNISFSIDEDTGRTVVKLMDSENNVLRQIPSEEVLHVIKSLEDNKGFLLEDYA